MTLRAIDCYEAIRHELRGGDPAPELSFQGLVNEAGQFWATSHTWKSLEGRQAHVAGRAEITLDNATWDLDDLTLTSAGAFANYTHVDGDQIEITAGANATLGFYTIASKFDDNTIFLTSSIGANDNDADIDGRLDVFTAALPADFGKMIGIEASGQNWSSFDFTSKQMLLDGRKYVGAVFSNYYGNIVHVKNSTDGPPTPVITFWPKLNTNEADFLTIYYRAKWVDVTVDSDALDIPWYAESLFLQLCRDVAGGYEAPTQGTVDERLARTVSGARFRAAVAQDDEIQTVYGTIRNGAADMESDRLRGVSRRYPSGITITGPV